MERHVIPPGHSKTFAVDRGAELNVHTFEPSSFERALAIVFMTAGTVAAVLFIWAVFEVYSALAKIQDGLSQIPGLTGQ